MTNYEKIKNMSVEEMAKNIQFVDGYSVMDRICLEVNPEQNCDVDIKDCVDCVKCWLNKEVSEV